MGCGQVWLDGLARNMIGKLVTRKLGRSLWIDLFEQEKNIKAFVSHVNGHQKVTSAEDFNNQVGKMAQSVDVSQLLSLAITVVTQ